VAECRRNKERGDVLEANLHAEHQKRFMQEMATSYTNIDILIYLLTAIGLSPSGSSTVQYSTYLHTNNTQNNTTILEECGPYPVLASYTLVLPYN
jgi:hypothetical protein